MVEVERDALVIKYGSDSVANDAGMDAVRVGRYAEAISDLSEQYNVVVVTSGAVATGRAIWLANRGEDEPIPDGQSLATLGADDCFSVWKNAFLKQGKLAGSIQVTHHEIDDEIEGGTLGQVLSVNFNAGIISLINENDALSDIEIAALKYGGDNDGLATHIATKIWASHVLFMTGVEGVLDKRGRLVETVYPDDYEQVREYAGPKGNNDMRSKVEACIKAVDEGSFAHVAHAIIDPRLVIDRQRGTHFIR